jgi:WD40 repeat protein
VVLPITDIFIKQCDNSGIRFFINNFAAKRIPYMLRQRLLKSILIIFLLTACAPSTAPSQNSEISSWQDIFIISVDSANTPTLYDGDLDLNTDTRWVIDLDVSQLREDESTGILIYGTNDHGERPVLFWVYQAGGWNLGYAPISAPDYTFTEFSEQLTSPSQHFEITISNAGKTLEITNRTGFQYSHVFAEPLFANATRMGTETQVGPYATLKILSFSIQQKQTGVVALDPEVASLQPIAPTAIPLPVDRFHPLPALQSISAENISDLEPVATFQDANLLKVQVSDTRDRVAAVFNNGVQVYDLPELTPRSFITINLDQSSGRTTYQLSSDDKYLANVSNENESQVILWDLDSGTKACTLDFPGSVDLGSRGPLLMDFFPGSNLFLFNGRWVNAEGKSTNAVQLVDLGTCRKIFELGSRLLSQMAVSPDGSQVAYVKDERVILFGTQEQKESDLGEAANLRGLGFSADSKSVILGYSYVLKMVELATGNITAQMDVSLGRDSVYLYALQDGHRILIAANESNRIWDLEGNKNYSLGSDLIAAYRSHFDDYNGTLVTTESVWNLDTRNRVDLTNYPYGRSNSALSPDGTFLAVDSGYAPWQTDLLNAGTGQVLTRLPGERAPIRVGEFFLTSGSQQILVHRFESGEVTQTIIGAYMNGTSLSDTQALLWNARGEIFILDVIQGQIGHQATMPDFPLSSMLAPDYYTAAHDFPAWEESLGGDPSALLTGSGRNTVLVSSDRRTAIQQSGDQVQIFRLTDGDFLLTKENLLASYGFNGVWFQFVFSPDGKLVAGKTYSQLFIWDAHTGQQVRGFIGDDYLKSNWFNFGFSPDAGLFLIDSIQQKDRVLTILDVQTGRMVQSHSVAGCNLSIPFAVTPDGSQVYTVTPDCRIGLYVLEGWQNLKSFGGPYGGTKLALALSPDGKWLAVGYQQSLEIWDVATGMQVKKFSGLHTDNNQFIGDYSLTFSPDGKILIARYGRWFLLGSSTTLFGVPATP